MRRLSKQFVMELRAAEMETQKKQLRALLLQRRRTMPMEKKQSIDRQICQHVLESPEYQRANVLFAYWSTAEEIDTHAILADAWKQGKCVCVPKCLRGHRMIARRIASEADLTEQTFGIPEPDAQCMEIAPEDIDLCLVPALACDASGARLGYGGGFYDRFLPQTMGNRMVLCAQERLLPEIPTEEHDMHCDCIVTENEVMRVHEK